MGGTQTVMALLDEFPSRHLIHPKAGLGVQAQWTGCGVPQREEQAGTCPSGVSASERVTDMGAVLPAQVPEGLRPIRKARTRSQCLWVSPCLLPVGRLGPFTLRCTQLALGYG